MFYKTLSIWLYIGLSSILFAQNSFPVKGVVVDFNTKQPIEGVNIIGKNLYSTSSATGEFIIYNVPKGMHSFTISHIGYSSKTIEVNVGPTMKKVEIVLMEAKNTLEQVAIKGKSTQRRNNENPTVSYAVTKEYLEKNRENSLMQTLSKIPGVSTINIGSGNSKPVIRGLGFNRVVVVQNGIKHEAQQWGSDHGLEIDQYGIDNIRIIKGPASLLYGSDAIAGIVDIKPNKIPAQNSFSGEINVVGESNNDLLGTSVGVQARNEKWFYRGRLTYKTYADYKVPTDKINYENYIFTLHDNNLRNTAGNEANGSFSVGYISKNIMSETTFSNVNAKNGFFANAHGLEVRTSSIDYDSSNRDIDLPYHKVNHFKVTNNTSITADKHTLYFDVGFQSNYREEHSEPIPHGYMPKPPNTKEREFKKNTYALNIRDVFKPNDKHNIVAGINLEYQDNNIGGWGFLIPEYNRFTVGAFAFNQYELNSNLHLLAGIRYDYGIVDSKSYSDWYPSTINNNNNSTSYVYLQRALNKTLNFGNFSSSLGLSYISNQTTYKINLGKSFRIPLANELASNGVNYHMYRYEKGNLNLAPEESYQLDIDINHTNKYFSVGVSPFVNLFDNYIYLNPTTNYFETLQIYEYTQSKVFRAGGEVSVEKRFFEKLSLNASAEYVYSKQKSGPKKNFTLPFSPPLTTMFKVEYKLKDMLFVRNTELKAEFKVVATQDEIVPPEKQTEGYQVLDLSLVTQLDVFKTYLPIDVRLKINNLLNTKYYNHTSFYRLIDVPEAGRNLSMSLTIPF